jgi:hypothetical protein
MPITVERVDRHLGSPLVTVRTGESTRWLLLVVAVVGGMLLSGCTSTEDPASIVTPSPAPINLSDRISTPAELPNNFLMQGIEDLTLMGFAAMWPDNLAAYTQLRERGFEQAVRRVSWQNPAVPLSVGETLSSLTMVGVEYGSHDAAVAAAEANRTALIGADGYQLHQVEMDPIGEVTLAATGSLLLNGRTFAVAHVWVIDDAVVIAYAGFSTEADPLADVIEIAAAAHTRL